MTKVCKKCGYWIDLIDNAWYDCFDDDACYDTDLNLQGYHEPLTLKDNNGITR